MGQLGLKEKRDLAKVTPFIPAKAAPDGCCFPDFHNPLWGFVFEPPSLIQRTRFGPLVSNNPFS